MLDHGLMANFTEMELFFAMVTWNTMAILWIQNAMDGAFRTLMDLCSILGIGTKTNFTKKALFLLMSS